MNREIIKIIAQVASMLATAASSLVITLALGVVEMKSWSWGAFFIFLAAVAWITYVLWDHDRKNVKREGKDRD